MSPTAANKPRIAPFALNPASPSSPKSLSETAGAGARLIAKREVAKAGLAVSLAATVATAFMGGRASRTLHLASGLALVGFSVWHALLYGKRASGKS